MSPILGIYASQISGHLFAPSGAYDSIATTTLGSAASSITFSSIPQTYTHLQLRLMTKEAGTATGGQPNILAAMNSDTTSTNYYSHYMYTTGGGTVAANGLTTSGYYYFIGNSTTSAGAYANMFSTIIVDLLDYTNTNKFKTARSLWGGDNNGSGEIGFNSGLWRSTSAISSITLSVAGGSNFAQYTTAALYGIKGN